MCIRQYTSHFLFFSALCLLFGLAACKKESYSDIPELEFVEFSKDVLLQNSQDSMFITLNFADGDGDIGSDEQDNLWIRDGRNDELVASYRIPNHSPAAEGELRKGQLKLIVYSSCCIYADGQFCVSRPQDPLQEMSYRIQVRDKAGNYSEIIETATLRLDCQ